LGRIDTESKEAVKALRDALKDKDAVVRICAAHALVHIDPKNAEDGIAALITDMEDPHESQLGKHFTLLFVADKGEVEDRTALSSLFEIMKDQEPFRNSPPGFTLGILARWAESPPRDAKNAASLFTRELATAALARCGKPAVTPLVKLLENRDEDVRQAAVTVLGEIGPEAKDAVEKLVPLLKDKNAILGQAVAVALKNIDPEAAKKAGVR
jgi:HEAT repeat protein